MREEAASKSESLPDDERFPIYPEPFWENAKRIPDGTVGLIATDPNWHLAEDTEQGEMWTLHGLPIAPQMTAETWHTFGQLAAQKLSVDGYAAILMGQQNVYEIESILRQYLSKRWVMCYLHASGAGTIARKAGFASHWRPLLVFQRKDATKKPDLYKRHAPDVVPSIPERTTFNDGLLELLRLERNQTDRRIAELEAEGADPFVAHH